MSKGKKVIIVTILFFFFIMPIFHPTFAQMDSLSSLQLLQTTVGIPNKGPSIWQNMLPIDLQPNQNILPIDMNHLTVVNNPSHMLFLPTSEVPTQSSLNQSAFLQPSTSLPVQETSAASFLNELSANEYTFPVSHGELTVNTATQTLTNKTISGQSNSFKDIPNAALVNASIKLIGGNGITITGGDVALGGVVTITNDATEAASEVLNAIGGTVDNVTIGDTTPSSGKFTTINGLTILNNGNNALNIASGKTLVANNSITFSGTDGTAFVLPNNSDMIAGLTTAQTFINKTLSAASNTISGLTVSNFAANTLSQWTNNVGFITNSSTDTLTNKILTSPAINGVVTTTGLTFPGFTASGTITGSGNPTITNFGSINGLTLTSLADGFTLSGGTTQRALTMIGGDLTIGSTIKPTNSGTLAIQSNGANPLTLDSGGNAGITIGTTNANSITLGTNATVSANKFFSVTTADKLTVGGTIIPQSIPIPVPLTATILTQPVFIADTTYQVTGAKCIPSIVSISGTFQVTVDSGTTAAGGGTSQLSSTISLSGVANTVVNGTLIASPTTINAGDRVSAKFGGILTGLLGTCTIYVKRV